MTLKADGQDLSYITVELTDSDEIRNPKSENLIEFEIDGPGEIIAVGNPNPMSLESSQQPQRKAWQGRCLVIIKSVEQAGNVLLTAKSASLKSTTINIKVN